ncbi:hypothetical protein HOC01_03820 [archaeon]|mgnify:CR=1 FL=1|jgi:hypothetical protein|nr:hypothetical protein [archaeon]MBT6698460.1 hypothetical protein [archaeon]
MERTKQEFEIVKRLMNYKDKAEEIKIIRRNKDLKIPCWDNEMPEIKGKVKLGWMTASMIDWGFSNKKHKRILFKSQSLILKKRLEENKKIIISDEFSFKDKKNRNNKRDMFRLNPSRITDIFEFMKKHNYSWEFTLSDFFNDNFKFKESEFSDLTKEIEGALKFELETFPFLSKKNNDLHKIAKWISEQIPLVVVEDLVNQCSYINGLMAVNDKFSYDDELMKKYFVKTMPGLWLTDFINAKKKNSNIINYCISMMRIWNSITEYYFMKKHLENIDEMYGDDLFDDLERRKTYLSILDKDYQWEIDMHEEKDHECMLSFIVLEFKKAKKFKDKALMEVIEVNLGEEDKELIKNYSDFITELKNTLKKIKDPKKKEVINQLLKNERKALEKEKIYQKGSNILSDAIKND